jgi:hypothetical protein
MTVLSSKEINVEVSAIHLHVKIISSRNDVQNDVQESTVAA